MNMKKSIYLPQFTIGEEAFTSFTDEMQKFGNSIVVIHGEKAWSASKDGIRRELVKAGFEISGELLYGKNATFENADKLISSMKGKCFDMLLAVGGGKCIDTVKVVADKLEKPVFTVPTIASNCSAVTKISIIYNDDGSFREIVKLKHSPIHCFINTKIVADAPIKYLWAGIGDAMAKNVESKWSSKAGEPLDYGSELGITASNMCFYPLSRDGVQALEDAKNGEISSVLEATILNIVVSPGITSVSVHPNYNGGIAHALFYGLTKREVIEKHHLHGEVVSYGTLVNLMLDKDWDKLKIAYDLNKALKLPVCLADLDLEKDDDLDDVLDATMESQELSHIPYTVNKQMIHKAILDLENYRI